MPVLLKLFKKIKKEGTLLNSFHKAGITQITKPDKDTIRKENYKTKPLLNISSKILNQYQQTKINSTLKEPFTIIK